MTQPDAAVPGSEPSRHGNVLVTGGAGFIGSALAVKAAHLADRWLVLDNLHSQVHAVRERPAVLPDAAELVVGEVTDAVVWDRLLAEFQPDTVVHLAAETGTAQSLHHASRHAEVNVVGTAVMLDALTRAGHVPRRVVLASSRAVYGEGSWRAANGTVFSPGPRAHAQLAAGRWAFGDATPLPSAASTTPPSPTSVYGATKLAQESILSAWCASNDSAFSILRLQNVYGPGQSLTNPYTGIVSLFAQIASRLESIPVYEDGRITRDFVFIDDVADAIHTAMLSGGDGRRIVDIGSGVATTILDLGALIADHYGAPPPHVTGEYRDGDVRHAECVLEADPLPGWRPRWSVERGLARLASWIEEQARP